MLHYTHSKNQKNRNWNQIHVRGVHKERPHSKGEGIVKCGQGGSSDANVCTFWCKKLRNFRNLWCVLTDKVGGVDFSRFCSDVFYGQPLIAILYVGISL